MIMNILLRMKTVWLQVSHYPMVHQADANSFITPDEEFLSVVTAERTGWASIDRKMSGCELWCWGQLWSLGAPASVLPAESEHARRLVRLETGVSTHAHMQDTDSGKNRDLGLPHSPHC